ncbi:hypothetical protein ACFQZ4_46335 [Catellatospora coxensis]|uniref:Uncharacterized protein n=1 Tax=Catellatospora coxensis TaxID=310354 RepID=A0A8J3KR14_9ACTN|nr:hypothetical protein Cco03nite_23150 [Catellatospora coxensis]
MRNAPRQQDGLRDTPQRVTGKVIDIAVQDQTPRPAVNAQPDMKIITHLSTLSQRRRTSTIVS